MRKKELKIGEAYEPKISEDFLQKLCVKWFKIKYPNILIHHSPNGGSRHIAEATKFKAMGVEPGCPDTLIFKTLHLNDQQNGRVNVLTIPGLAIELKVKGGKVSDHQRNFQEKLKLEGWTVEIAWSLDEFQFYVEQYMNRKDINFILDKFKK